MATQDMKELLKIRRNAANAAKTATVPATPAAEVPAAKPPRTTVGLGAQASAPKPAKTKAAPAPKVIQPTAVVDDGDDEGDEDDEEIAPEPAQVQQTLATQNARSSTPLMQHAIADPTREITDRDLVMPRLSIAQAMSKVVSNKIVEMGHWYNSPQNTDLGDTIYVILTDMRKSRSMFENGQVMCRSFDMRQGEGDLGILCEGTFEEIANGIPESQRGCPYRLWGERNEAGKSSPPPCQQAYNFPLLILDPDDLHEGRCRQAILTLRGTAATTAKQMISTIMEGGYYWHEVILKLSITQKSNARGTFYVPQVEFFGDSSGSNADRAAKLAARVSGVSLRSSLERSDID